MIAWIVLATLIDLEQVDAVRPESWSGITPGITARKAIEDRFGAAMVVNTLGESVYINSAIKRGGQDEHIPAKELLIAYNKFDIVFSVKVCPISKIYDITWLEKHYGRPDVRVLNSNGFVSLVIYHNKHITALLSGLEKDNAIIELIITAP